MKHRNSLITVVSVLFCAMILFTTCKKDSDTVEVKTTFQIINNIAQIPEVYFPYYEDFTHKTRAVKSFNGTLWQVEVYYYKGTIPSLENYRPAGADIDSIPQSGGISDIVEIKVDCDRVQIRFKLLSNELMYYSGGWFDLCVNNSYYIVDFFDIQKDQNNLITISNETMTSLGTLTTWSMNDLILRYKEALETTMHCFTN